MKPAYDKLGRKIHAGDLLRTFHFVARRWRQKQYLYHVVRHSESQDCLEAIPYTELAFGEVRGEGGRWWLIGWQSEAEVINGPMIDGLLYSERPKITKAELDARM